MDEISEGIGPACAQDSGEIHDIIEFWSSKQKILQRSREEIENLIKDFVVFRRGGRILGLVSIYVYDRDFAELRSLSVREGFGSRGIGKRLVAAAIERAKEMGIKKLFVLTNIPGFFSCFGFMPGNKVNDKKIWKDCLNCPKREKCDEVYMELSLD